MGDLIISKMSLQSLRSFILDDLRDYISEVKSMDRDEVTKIVEEYELSADDLSKTALPKLRDLVIKNIRSQINDVKVMKRDDVIKIIKDDDDLYTTLVNNQTEETKVDEVEE